MRITEALTILRASDKTSNPFRVELVCGFTPLHLSTFLAAHLQQRLNGGVIEVSTGLFGDVTGSLESLSKTAAHAVVIALEWQDLDLRLGFRSAGRWGEAAATDILNQVPKALGRIRAALQRLPAGITFALSAPTMPLPPLFHTAGWQSSAEESELEAVMATFLADTKRQSAVRVVNARRLSEESPVAERFDLKSDLLTGFPYTMRHADVLGAALARVLIPDVPKKGLITDLDDTLWSGLVGEVGPEGITWDLANHKALHGLYQKLLASLAEEGVLVGVASKNDSAVVMRAMERPDLLISPEVLFPMEVGWNAKSLSVTRILKQWNISADTVVFVDDSPLELAEVSAIHTGIECIQFPGKDYGTSGHAMLRRLRDLFGKTRLSEEDALRVRSIRGLSAFNAGAQSQGASEEFLGGLEAVLSVEFLDAETDARALELVNKTNQFNLNGIRFTEAEWTRRLMGSDYVTAVIAYEDKFGPLGKIAVLQGLQEGKRLLVDVWVLSCRAFARRIEHQALRLLFDRLAVDAIEFAFVKTAKNGPTADFLLSVCGASHAVTRAEFDERCPPLYHKVKEARRVEVNG